MRAGRFFLQEIRAEIKPRIARNGAAMEIEFSGTIHIDRTDLPLLSHPDFSNARWEICLCRRQITQQMIARISRQKDRKGGRQRERKKNETSVVVTRTAIENERNIPTAPVIGSRIVSTILPRANFSHHLSIYLPVQKHRSFHQRTSHGDSFWCYWHASSIISLSHFALLLLHAQIGYKYWIGSIFHSKCHWELKVAERVTFSRRSLLNSGRSDLLYGVPINVLGSSQVRKDKDARHTPSPFLTMLRVRDAG